MENGLPLTFLDRHLRQVRQTNGGFGGLEVLSPASAVELLRLGMERTLGSRDRSGVVV